MLGRGLLFYVVLALSFLGGGTLLHFDTLFHLLTFKYCIEIVIPYYVLYTAYSILDDL